MSKLVKCKVCGSEIASSAKACPSCGAKNKKPFYKKWWVWAILAAVVIAMSTSENTNNNVIDNTNNNVVENTNDNVAESNAENTPVVEENSPKISMNEFEALQTGMTYEEVVAIIGGEGELSSQVDIAGYDTKMYMWDGEGSIGANANLTFQNDSLTSKAQFGLK